MEMSVREGKAQFSAIIAAAERGETVTITKHGKVVAQVSPPRKVKNRINLDAGEVYLSRSTSIPKVWISGLPNSTIRLSVAKFWDSIGK